MSLFSRSATVFAMIAASFAAPPAVSAQAVTNNAWTIGYDRLACALAWQLGDPGSPVLLLTIATSDDDEGISLHSRDGPLTVAGEELEIDLLGEATRTFRARAPDPAPSTHSRYYEIEHDDFFDGLAGSRAIVIRGTGLPATEIRPPSAAAIATIRACHRRALADWGIDVEARARLQRLPRSGPGGFPISSSDYPSSAIRAGAQGTVHARIGIAADGTVEACEVVGSSGNRALDITTCRLTQERARFEPALDARGQAVAADMIHVVTWTLAGH